jgi:eukaryotic-like serine/threonine-protein kinase
MKVQASLHGSRLGAMQSSAHGPLSQNAPIELPFAPGEIIAGKYEVIGLIGSGGMGYVVSARHVELGELVAIKFLRTEALGYEELVGRFAREARASVRIKSEHVARVYDVGNLPNGVPFIVMEYLEGKDLGDVLQEQGHLPIKIAVEYVMQACEALASAHALGTVHRDVKPENLFLTRHGQGVDVIKVLDFGISKVALSGAIAHGPRQFVRTTMPIGSPVYMSPEQIRSSENVDARTDIWSLGCVLFELLTGRTAFDAPTLMELGASILGRDPVPLRTFLPDAPAELEAIVLKCLEKDVEKRFQNIAELGIALYPYGPRRARISAERCQSLLKGTNPAIADLELASIAPPSSQEGPPTTRRREATLSSPVSSGTPIAIDAEPAPQFRPRRRGLMLLAGAAALGVLGYLNWPTLAKVAGTQPALPQPTAVAAGGAVEAVLPEPVKAVEAVRPVAVPGTPHVAPATPQVNAATVAESDVVAEDSENKAEDDKTAAPEARARKRYRAPTPAPVVRPVIVAPTPAPKPKHLGRPGEEPDVGF